MTTNIYLGVVFLIMCAGLGASIGTGHIFEAMIFLACAVYVKRMMEDTNDN